MLVFNVHRERFFNEWACTLASYITSVDNHSRIAGFGVALSAGSIWFCQD